MTDPAPPREPIKLKKPVVKPEPDLDSLRRERQADKPLDIVGRLTLENLPAEQRDVIGQALKRMEEERYRRYFKRDEERVTMRGLLTDALHAVSEARGWELSPETYDIALFFAALDHQHLDKETLILHHSAGLVIAAIHDELRRSDQGRDLAELDFYLAQGSYRDAVIERKAMLEKTTGLYNDPDTVRDRFVAERDSFLRERDSDEVMVVVEIDFVHLKELNSRYGIDVVDAQIFVPLGVEFRKRFRSRDIRCRFGGDELTLILTRVQSKQVERMLLHVQDVVERCKYGENISPGAVKVRVGANVLRHDDLTAIQTTDSKAFIKEIRHQALIANEVVKRRMMAGDTQRVAVWDASMDDNQEVAWEVMADDVMRANITMIADLRTKFGDEAAEVFKDGLEMALRDAGNKVK